MSKIKSILEFAMRMEKNARDFYSYYGEMAQDQETKRTFGELADIENQHFLYVKAKYDLLGFSAPPNTIAWVVDDFSKELDPHIIADDSDLIAGEGKSNSDISIIRMAFLIENDFAEFYSRAVDAVEEQDIKEFLSELKTWETQHKELFYKKYQSMLAQQWGDIASFLN